MKLITEGTIAAANLSSEVAVRVDTTNTTYTMTADARLSVRVQVGDDTSGELAGGERIKISPFVRTGDMDAGNYGRMPGYYMDVPVGEDYVVVQLEPIYMENGDKIQIKVTSNDTADSAVLCKAWLVDLDQVNLVADAITSAKYDESSAYPVKSADTGSTQIARVGADSDTLETISDQLDTAQTDLNTITGTGGVLIGTDVMDRSGTLDINTKTITTDAIDNDALNANAVTEIVTGIPAAVWTYGTRQLTNANNITSTGNALVIHTDHKVILAGTTHTSAVVPTTTVVTNAVGIDWNAISNPTATVALTNTTIGVCTVNSDMVGTDGAALAATALTDATWTDARAGYLDELASGNIPTDLAAIQTVTDALPNAGALSDIDTGVNNLETAVGTAGDGLTDLGGMSSTMKAQVRTEADAALVANHLDHIFKTNYDPASKPGTATALFNELVENDGGVSRYTANALEQAPSGAGLSGDQSTWLEACYDLLYGDRVIVTATTPWTLEYRDKDSKSVLLTQDLKNTAAANITNKSNVLGSLVLTT